MNKNTAIAIIVVLALGIGFWMYSSRDIAMTTPDEVNEVNNEEIVNETDANGNIVDVAISGNNFAFSENEIRVKEGDTVRVTFTNATGVHDWVIDEFNARTQVLQAGGVETVTFVADKKGTFEYYCSVGSHRAMGMKGNLIVE